MTARPIRPARSASRFAQRGAGMLLATVFLLVVVALFGLIALRMASTDVTDSAVQSDSIEALFLAESGLERTAQRLVAGTPCTALLPDAVQFLGRGTFQITRAVPLPSGLCQVRVLGSVGLPGATPAQRLIEADLSLGGCRGFAVGERINSGPPAQRGAVLLCWDGSTWTRAAFAGLPNANLYSVSCPAANDCWAVGAPSGGENILHWDGTAWTRWPISAIPNVNLWSIHCVADDDCWAVGNAYTGNPAAQRGEVIIHWNGSTWTRSGPWNDAVTGVPNVQLNAVTCSASNDCWAVGNTSSGEVIAHWNGVSWTRVVPSGAVPDVILRGVSCVTDTDCRAVGSPSGGEVLLEWNGTWSRSGLSGSIPNNATFNAVDCTSWDNCWAVGNRSGGELLARWNGAAWSRHPQSNAIPNRTLRGLFMVDANEGYSVGDNGLIIRWNSSNWTTQASPVTAQLRSVGMAPSGGGGSAGVQRWREIIQ